MLLNWGHIPQGMAAKVKGPTGVSRAQQLARLRFLVGGNSKVPPPGQHGPISNRHSALDPPPPPRPYKAGPGGPQQRSSRQTSGWDCGGPAAATAAADAPGPHMQRRPSVAAREARLPSPASACLPPRGFRRPRWAGAMRLGPRLAAAAGLGLLLLLYAAVAGASKAEELHYPQGEHRADYDREALLGVQVRMPGWAPHRHGLCPVTKRDDQERP